PGVGLFATHERHVRSMPGRIVGETVDARGRRGFVLTLAAREQHIRRERATSNICTNQGLCALAVAIHLSLLGRHGLRAVAALNYRAAHAVADRLATGGVVRRFAGPLPHAPRSGTEAAIADLPPALRGDDGLAGFPEGSELETVRHFVRLSQWNYSAATTLYPLGSCTMKYNPVVNEAVARLHGFAALHPLVPDQLAQGALELIAALERALAAVSGLDAVCLQPAAGAQGELLGMLL